MNIALNKPYWGRREEKVAIDAIRHTLGTGDGKYSKKMSTKLKKLLGSTYVFPVTSCTHAMDLAMATLGVGKGDEVIVPSFTMTSTANCVVLAGATPVFVDISPITYNIDPEDVKRAITKRTKGIMVVHYAGMACDMEKIMDIARKNKLFVVEDAAHAIGATYKGKALGTFGTAGAFSFHGTKNISCGEGGVLVTDDKKLADTIQIFRANGTNRHDFLKGVVSKYHWVGPGTSYFLSDILASLIYIQLDQITKINNKRGQIASYYTKKFTPYKEKIQLPIVPKGVNPNWHIYALRLPTTKVREKFMKFMGDRGIDAFIHYVPLHSSPMGKKLGGTKRELPVTKTVASTLVRLPIYPDLTKRELTYVVQTAQKAFDTLL